MSGGLRSRARAALLGALVSIAASACAAPYSPVRPPPGDPPPAALRWPAEWEPNAGVLVTYPFALPRDLLVALAAREGLVVLVARHDRARLAADVGRLRLARSRVRVVEALAGRPYPRDFGPQVARLPDGERIVIDGAFQGYPHFAATASRSRDDAWTGGAPAEPGDDDVAASVARALGLDVVRAPLALTGGNLLTDGAGTFYFTDALIDENAPWHGRERTLELLRAYTGAQRLVHLPNVEGLGIQHLDCWLMPLPGARLLVKRAPTDHPAHARIEAAVEELAALETDAGPLTILRVDCPAIGPGAHGDEPALAAYTNALVTATTAYVPLWGRDEDAAALAAWRGALPGHDVRGFPWDGWEGHDALHCRTRVLPAP